MQISINKYLQNSNIEIGKISFDQYKKYVDSFNCSNNIAGFIYHPSRCGSTLMCRLLNQLDKVRVVSEPRILPQLIIKTFHSKNNLAVNPEILKTLIAGLMITKNPTLKSGFIKLNSWSIELLPLISLIYKEIPWVYICRNPIEILVSNLKNPSKKNKLRTKEPQLLAKLFELSVSTILDMPMEEFHSLFLKRNMKVASDELSTGNNNGLVVNYSKIKSEFYSKILPHFSINANSTESEKISNTGKLYSKSNNPVLFKEDSREKRAEADKYLIDLVDSHKLDKAFSVIQQSLNY